MRKSLLSLLVIDPRSLATFRVGLGTLLLADLAVRAVDLMAHYSDAGAVPRSVVLDYRPHAWPWSLHMLHGSTVFAAFLFALATAAAVCLAVGWRTRLATVVSWLLLVSLHVRNPVLLNGGDVLLRVLLFWSMFLPLGRHGSVDQWRRRDVGKAMARPSAFELVAAACMLLQVCTVYWMSSYWKLTEGWGEADVLLRIMQFDTYAKAPAYALQHYPGAVAIMGRVIVWAELIGPCLVWLPVFQRHVRLLVVAMFYLLHFGIELTLTVGLFSYVCWLAWILFLPDMFWNSILGGWQGIKTSAKGGESGAASFPSPAGRHVQRNAGHVGSRLAWLLIFVSVLLVGCRVSWMDGAPKLQQPLRTLARIVLLGQKWDLFSEPPRNDGWHVMVAHLKNGADVDLLRDGQAADWMSFSKPAYCYRRYANHRWRKYYRRLVGESRESFRGPLCEYLARRWNQAHDENEQIEQVVMYFMKEVAYADPADVYQQKVLHVWNQELNNRSAKRDEETPTSRPRG